ncbi:uncharacterized protein [Haliotis cracherodii]|uniref:uncharacterized protein isoform X1 n=1 Tax=Haliotis cracherodii TaxID=6455 RepID=UPI0039E7996F
MFKRDIFLLTLVFHKLISAHQSCGGFHVRRHSSLDNLLFNEAFMSEHVVEGRLSCAERCYRHPLCNMLLHNPTSKRCRLYKSFINTGGTEEPGWQYYAAECNHFRVENALSLTSVNQSVDVACGSGFTHIPSSSFYCSLGTEVLNIGRCAQTRWINPVSPWVTDLSAPLSPGVEIKVRGAGDGGGNTDVHLWGPDNLNCVFLLSIRWFRPDAIFNTQTSGTWGTELRPSTFIFSPNVVFDVLVRITTTQFLRFLIQTHVLYPGATRPCCLPGCVTSTYQSPTTGLLKMICAILKVAALSSSTVRRNRSSWPHSRIRLRCFPPSGLECRAPAASVCLPGRMGPPMSGSGNLANQTTLVTRDVDSCNVVRCLTSNVNSIVSPSVRYSCKTLGYQRYL